MHIMNVSSRLNLIKLCVGCPSPELLAQTQAARAQQPVHVTRMWPKREAELLAGGSLYWVMNSEIRCRQLITGFSEVIGDDDLRRCAIELEPEIILVRPTLRRPFQGWRYLQGADAPADLPRDEKEILPAKLETALNALGVT